MGRLARCRIRVSLRQETNPQELDSAPADLLRHLRTAPAKETAARAALWSDNEVRLGRGAPDKGASLQIASTDCGVESLPRGWPRRRSLTPPSVSFAVPPGSPEVRVRPDNHPETPAEERRRRAAEFARRQAAYPDPKARRGASAVPSVRRSRCFVGGMHPLARSTDQAALCSLSHRAQQGRRSGPEQPPGACMPTRSPFPPCASRAARGGTGKLRCCPGVSMR